MASSLEERGSKGREVADSPGRVVGGFLFFVFFFGVVFGVVFGVDFFALETILEPNMAPT